MRVSNCTICGLSTGGTCHEQPVCNHHKVIVRPLYASAAKQGSGAFERCVCCAWEEARPADSAEVLFYLRNVAIHAMRAGWDILIPEGGGIVDLLAGAKGSAMLRRVA